MSLDFRNISLIDAIENTVESMQVDGKPYFEFGHIKEIANTLRSKPKDKYPLIILLLDVTSKFQKLTNTFDYQNVTIYIVNHTEPNYSAAQRKSLVFDAVLIPIYENFIEAIRENKTDIDNRNNIPFIEHSKTDRYFWGSSLNAGSTNNVVGDYLDCIELKFQSIKVKNINC